jgi:acetate kinase
MTSVPHPESVLVHNFGSSSVKFALLDPVSGERAVTGLGERIGTPHAVVHVRRGDDPQLNITADDGSHRAVVASLLASLTADELASIAGVGHRVVHGGEQFSASVLVDDKVLADLRGLVDLAPLHMPANIAGIEAARDSLPDLPQGAVFDTAFHATMPPHAYRYAVPTEWYAEHGARRYGFHGTSHRYVSARAAELLGRPLESLRMVTLHLGNGCSAAAVRDGVSVDTTMGLTPLEGLVMGTRSGDVDPGLLGYIGDRLGLGLGEVLDALNKRSGLLGLSGSSNDMRTLEQAAHGGDADAQLAMDVFAYRAAKAVGGLAVALGRLDAVVFTGGIGERGPETRRDILGHLEVLGLHVDDDANADHGRRTNGRISREEAPVALVVPTDEELVIARDTRDLAGGGGAGPA